MGIFSPSIFGFSLKAIISFDSPRLPQTFMIAYCFISCLNAGSITAFSLWTSSLMTDLRFSEHQITLLSIVAELSIYLSVPILGLLCDYVSGPYVSFLGGAVISGGYIIAFNVAKSGTEMAVGVDRGALFELLFAFFAIGVGTSASYLAALTMCAKDFSESQHRGTVMAVPVTGYGLSGLVTTLAVRILFADPESGHVNLPQVFLVLAAVSIIVGLLGLIDWRGPRLDQSVLGVVVDRSYNTFANSDEESSVDSELDHQPRLKTVIRRFISDHTSWLTLFSFFLISGPCESFINSLGTLIPAITSDKGDPGTYVAIFSVMSSISRVAAGLLTDGNLRFRLSKITLLICSISSCGLAFFTISLGRETLMPLCAALIGLGYGTVFTLMPVIVSVVWGTEHFGTHWGLIEIAPGIGAACWGWIYSALFTAASFPGSGRCYGWGCYGWTYLGMGISAITASALAMLAWRCKGGWRGRDISL